MALEVRNRLQAEDQNFMWLQGSDLFLSLKSRCHQALESQSPDCAYPITRNQRNLDGVKMTYSPILWEVGTLA